ncbi:MAG: heavy metal translocating P-type ATPase [Planctomycetota bacterium]|nr:MAG: heavy metal translocating P-type ATPase [Planctomycetota bacterium]
MSAPEPNRSLAPPEGAALAKACLHCREPIPRGRERFCCSGCEAVHGLLSRAGLSNYYRVAEDLGATPPRPQDASDPAAAWDDPRFLELHTTLLPGGQRQARLYLEGVHCAACVWLVEALPRLLPGVVEARLELGRALATVRWDPRAVPLSEVARTLAALGYRPHPARGLERSERARREERALWIRIAVAGALAGNVMLVSFALYSGAFGGMDAGTTQWFRLLALGLTVPAVVGPGSLFLRGAWGALRARSPHMDLPVALALLVGLGWGAANTLRGSGEVYFDTVSVLVFLLLVGRALQHRQQRRAGEAAAALGSLAPRSARKVEGERTQDVPIEALSRGDLLLVRAGEAFPCDGRVEEGRSRIDASLLTGESRPRAVASGDEVLAGTLNLTAELRVRALRTGEETRLAGIVAQVEECQRRKAPVVAWADRIAGVFVTGVLALALLTLGLWLWLDPAVAVDRAVALLIVTCPCALGLATPLAIAAALGAAAREGIVVKGGAVLQALAAPGTLWLDKTGTLSEGRATLVAWEGPDPEALEEAKGWVKALEASSTHPVAQGIEEAFADIAAPRLDAPPQAVAAGVAGCLGGERLLVGSPACVESSGLDLPAWARKAVAGVLRRGATPVVAARGERIVAVGGLGDPLRPEARGIVKALAAAGWRVGILSGDHPAVVSAVGAALDLPSARCFGGLLPEEKRARVEASRGEGPVVMVGDGVNDAVALAAADVGVGVRGGSEAALASADVFFARRGLEGLPRLLGTASRTLGRVRTNLVLSLAYNLLAAFLAVAGVIGPLLAAVLMPLSSLAVVANSYRGLLREDGPR